MQWRAQKQTFLGEKPETERVEIFLLFIYL